MDDRGARRGLRSVSAATPEIFEVADRRNRAGNGPGAPRGQRLGIRRLQTPIVASTPPDDPGASAVEREPRGHVRLMIGFADDDLRPRAEGLTDGEADRADERRGVEA